MINFCDLIEIIKRRVKFHLIPNERYNVNIIIKHYNKKGQLDKKKYWLKENTLD